MNWLGGMNGKMIVDLNPVARAKTEIAQIDDKLVVRNTMDAEPIIERNKKLFNSGEDGYSPRRTLRRVATLDMVTYLDLHKRGILRSKKKMARWLNDPENRFFRTAPGRV